MPSSQWEELESLSRDIGDARERLQSAKARRKSDMARVLEQEIADLEKRQGELLAVIANSVVAEQEEATAASPADSTGDPPSLVAPDVNKSVDTEPSAQRDQEETAVWKQLTPADVEQARRGLMRQRAETLARHAEELKSLDAENAEVAALEQAIQAFMRKFGGAEVVPLEPNQSRA
jgi:hypothetical protein